MVVLHAQRLGIGVEGALPPVALGQNGGTFEETVQFTTKDGRAITGTPMVANVKRSRMGETVSV
ncbi:hypothetical protein [Corynebacterium appendicis]|uniref:hypothetical protein n=1 Tax=Corynebacterium appendicis TaxID=163202 RepID=UPI00254A8387|nr:hypothetical protein [Corynebacterium appendicis]MDK8625211.1 hypothetical protein [Corynebacterium appendicis]